MTLPARILAILESAPGRANAITGAQLAKDLCGDAQFIRTIQMAVNDLRNNGHPICSADSGYLGYYMPVTMAEAETFHKSTKARAQSTFITLANVTRALNRRFVTDKFQARLELV